MIIEDKEHPIVLVELNVGIIKDKNIIVTGASGGIGSSIVQKLCEMNANVLATGTKVEKLKQLKDRFNKINTLVFDISKHDKIEDFINDCLSKKLDGSILTFLDLDKNPKIGQNSTSDLATNLSGKIDPNIGISR